MKNREDRQNLLCIQTEMADSLKEVEENSEIKLSDLNFILGEKPSLELSKFDTSSLCNTVG